MNTTPIMVGNLIIGGLGRPLALIAGPCVIESEDHALKMAEAIRDLARKLGVGYIFKASFDKANRTSLDSFRGPGLKEGLRILRRVKNEIDVPVLSDIHAPEQAAVAAEVLDILQIPAFLSRQTDLLAAAAQTGLPINVKKGQFMAPWDVKPIIGKLEGVGNRRILLTERGVSFGYNRLVTDFRAIPIMRGFGYPVVFDATHSVQEPGGQGTSSGGKREFVPLLARAAAAVGVDALFMEVHDDPERALSDGPNMVRLADLEAALTPVVAIDRIVKAGEETHHDR